MQVQPFAVRLVPGESGPDANTHTSLQLVLIDTDPPQPAMVS